MRSAFCILQPRQAYHEDSLFHSDRGAVSDNLEDTEVYIDLGDDPVDDLRDELKTLVQAAADAGLSASGVSRLNTLLKEHM